MQIIFMGTPDFSVGTLKALIAAGHEIVLAVTQPDKPKGRGKAVAASPVKEAALAHGIKVFQPRRVREPESVEYLREFRADVIVVVAFGQILPKEILEMPPYGCVNVHASLLPKYRGAAPIQWAVINGEKVSGVTTMRMDEGLDTGDLILREEVALAPKETGGSLFDKLSEVGARLCVQTLEAMENGTAIYTPQNHEEATKVGMIKKQFGLMDWTKSAQELECLIRGLNPWPSAYTHLDGKMLKIWDADVVPGMNATETLQTVAHSGREDLDEVIAGKGRVSGVAGNVCGTMGDTGRILTNEEGQSVLPGMVVRATRDAIYVQTGNGILKLNEVQLEGKKRMDCGAFLRGNAVPVGIVLGV